MTTILEFVLILSLLIIIHELGHFLAAKISNVKVEEFGIGLPPKIFTFGKFGETEYTLNLLPFGGFVRLHGESLQDPNHTTVDPNRSFYHKSNPTKAFILIAGVTMNLILGMILTGVVIIGLGKPEIETSLFIDTISENSPAYTSNIQAGDQIVMYQNATINDGLKEVTSSSEFISFINENKNQEIELLLQAETQDQYSVRVVPRSDPPPGEGPLGISFIESASMAYYPVAWHEVPYYTVNETYSLMHQMISGIGIMLSDLVTQGTIPQDITGPIGIAKITGEVAQQGFFQLVQFTAIISLNLCIINTLPFPALDGGRLFFVVIESISRKKINPRYEAYIHATGMIILLALVLILSIHDFRRFY